MGVRGLTRCNCGIHTLFLLLGYRWLFFVVAFSSCVRKFVFVFFTQGRFFVCCSVVVFVCFWSGPQMFGKSLNATVYWCFRHRVTAGWVCSWLCFFVLISCVSVVVVCRRNFLLCLYALAFPLVCAPTHR